MREHKAYKKTYTDRSEGITAGTAQTTRSGPGLKKSFKEAESVRAHRAARGKMEKAKEKR